MITTVTVQGSKVVVDVAGVVTGSYSPATWGHFGGDPAEEPEVDLEVIVIEDNEDPECREAFGVGEDISGDISSLDLSILRDWYLASLPDEW